MDAENRYFLKGCKYTCVNTEFPVIESKYELDDICLEIHHTVKIMAFKHLTSFAVFPTSSFIILLQDFMGNEYSQRIQLLFKIYAA